MISNLYILISTLIGSLITFLTFSVLLEIFFTLANIKKGRVRSILRLLPSVSVFLDLIYNSYNAGYWLNPLNCSSCVQKIILSLFFPDLKSYLYSHEISLISYLGWETSHTLASIIFLVFFSVLFYSVFRTLFTAFLNARTLKMMRINHCPRPIENPLLVEALQKHNVKIYVSEDVSIPMATYSRTIILPQKSIEMLPKHEFEAIVAHELEHIIWYDPVFRLISLLFASFFFFAPTSNWLKKLELDQEIACDQSILKYGLNEDYLASALIRVAKMSKNKPQSAFCYLVNEKNPALRRVQIMLGLTTTHSEQYGWPVIVTCGIIICLCSFY